MLPYIATVHSVVLVCVGDKEVHKASQAVCSYVQTLGLYVGFTKIQNNAHAYAAQHIEFAL